MQQATKEDISELHGRIDALDTKMDGRLGAVYERQGLLSISLAEIKATLKMQPPIPARPCAELTAAAAKLNGHVSEFTTVKIKFEDHVAHHQDSKELWTKPFVGMLIHLVELAVVALLTWFFVGAHRSLDARAGLPDTPDDNATQPRASSTLE